MLRLANSKGGRILIYVWAIEQDEASKRVIPPAGTRPDPGNLPIKHMDGADVLVPWVHNSALKKATAQPSSSEPAIYKRYYHMFAQGELREIVMEAATNLGLIVGPSRANGAGVEITQEGWERSNYYVELLLWNQA